MPTSVCVVSHAYMYTKTQKNFKILFITYQIFRHMHKVLNIDENKNYLHSLVKIYEINILSLLSLWLDNNYYKQIKILQYRKIFTSENMA